jgi:hypothetical protein
VARPAGPLVAPKEGEVSDALTEDPVLTLGLGLMNEFVELFAFES